MNWTDALPYVTLNHMLKTLGMCDDKPMKYWCQKLNKSLEVGLSYPPMTGISIWETYTCQDHVKVTSFILVLFHVSSVLAVGVN